MCPLADNDTDEERGFRIGQECFTANLLCSNRMTPGI
jgi:hypothetical protein